MLVSAALTTAACKIDFLPGGAAARREGSRAYSTLTWPSYILS